MGFTSVGAALQIHVDSGRTTPIVIANAPSGIELHGVAAASRTEPGKEKAYGRGLLSLYNHSSSPNIELRGGPVPESMAAVALRDIAVGEELCFDHGHVWFGPV